MDITQKELAGHLKIADSTLSYWEMGKYEPDSDALMKLSRFFKVPIDYILGGDFTKWDINEENKLNPDEDLPYYDDIDMSVSEAGYDPFVYRYYKFFNYLVVWLCRKT